MQRIWRKQERRGSRPIVRRRDLSSIVYGVSHFEIVYTEMQKERFSTLLVGRTRPRVLDPGRGPHKAGYFWAAARDDRP